MAKYIRALKVISGAMILSSLVACGGGGGSPGVPIIGSTSTQAQGWVVSLIGTSYKNKEPQEDCMVGQNGKGILCNLGGPNDSADSASGAIIETYGVNLVATVIDKGGPVSGATVTFSMGSSQTATTGSYCSTATATTTPNCSSAPNGALDGTLASISYQPGLNDGTGKVTSPITATTGADGKAYAFYYPGGTSGTDVVSVVATSNAATPGGNILQAQNSATIVVK